MDDTIGQAGRMTTAIPTMITPARETNYVVQTPVCSEHKHLVRTLDEIKTELKEMRKEWREECRKEIDKLRDMVSTVIHQHDILWKAFWGAISLGASGLGAAILALVLK